MPDLEKYYLPLGMALGTYFTLLIIKKYGIVRLKKISQYTEIYWDDLLLSVLEQTKQLFMVAVALYVGFHGLKWDKLYVLYADRIFIIIVALQAITWGKHAVNTWAEITLQRKNNDPGVKMTLGFLGVVLKFSVIVLVVLFALNNMGVNVTTFIAGLGIGGVAIALATQKILGDLFSSLSIVMDKPFLVGDFISLGEFMGTIEHVGLKSTRLTSLSGEQLVISNSDLLASKIRNFKRMKERRVVFQLGVTYQTKREDLKKAPKIIEEIIRAEPLTRFDRAHFMRYGAFSLDIEAVYIMTTPEYNDYMDTHQRILFAIHEAFEKNNLEFAFPTQTVILEKNERPV